MLELRLLHGGKRMAALLLDALPFGAPCGEQIVTRSVSDGQRTVGFHPSLTLRVTVDSQGQAVRATLLRRSLANACLLILFAAASLVAEEPAKESIEEEPIGPGEREHWAFRPLECPEVPQAKDDRWSRNPVDRFILAGLEKRGLRPQPEADRTTLLRRIHFDLTGLPPSPEQVDTFLADERPAAYERSVERLLASPAYGERWAQHWLDLARFAETDGFEHDKVRPNAYKYRDWVIDALNRDMPYDRFVRLQLAGDELRPDDRAARIATAFCLSGPDMPDINSQPKRRHLLLNEMTATVGSVFLALQLGCAQCHDHKYDPVSQADFYRLRAIFQPAVHVKKNRSVDFLSEPSRDPAPSYLHVRGEWDRLGPELEPAFPRIANPSSESLEPNSSGKTSGRRRELAQWLTRPDHPLTSRVIANRLWQHHFGKGLCRTPSDFGIMGHFPSHPELLDWLACELVHRGWSLKAMHRLLVTSATYRQASRRRSDHADTRAAWERAQKLDPENELWWRAARRRLSGEAIRDAMLASSGRLCRKQGGRGVMPPLPEELKSTLLRGQWKTSDNPEDHCRRSIYVFARRNLRYPIFDVFDRPDGNASCARRNRSTTAPQSLYLLNSEFSLDCTRRLAELLLAESSGETARLRLLYRRVLGRDPSQQELAECREFLAAQAELLAEGDGEKELSSARAAAWTDLCLAMFNFSEFVYLD